MKGIKYLWVIATLLILVNLVTIFVVTSNELLLSYISNSLPILTSLIAVIFLVRTVTIFKQLDQAKISWLLITVSLALDFSAELIYAIFEIVLGKDMNEIFPALADYLWALAYIPLIVGLVMIVKGYKKSGFPLGNQHTYIAIVASLVLFVVWVCYFLLIPIFKDAETTLLKKSFYLLFPLADLIVAIMSITLLFLVQYFGKGAISVTWKLITLGFLAFTLADLLYSYLSWKDVYNNGNLIDVAWNGGYLLIALAAANQYQLLRSIQKGGRS